MDLPELQLEAISHAGATHLQHSIVCLSPIARGQDDEKVEGHRFERR